MILKLPEANRKDSPEAFNLFNPEDKGFGMARSDEHGDDEKTMDVPQDIRRQP